MARPNQRKAKDTPFHVRKTTLLPSSLRDELVAKGKLDAPKDQNTGKKDTTSVFGRKQRRKDERTKTQSRPQPQRQQAKQNGAPGKGKGKADGQQADASQGKADAQQQAPVGKLDKGKQREDSAIANKQAKGKKHEKTANTTPDNAASSSSSSKKRKRASTSTEQEDSSKQRLKVSSSHQTPLERLLAQTFGPSSSSASDKLGGAKRKKPVAAGTAEEQEDQEIAWLEYKLGRDKAKKEYEEDGLDDLFEDLDRLDKDLLGGESDDGSQEDSEEEEDESDDDGLDDEMEGLLAAEDSGEEEGEAESEADEIEDEDEQILSEAEDLAEFYSDDEDEEAEEEGKQEEDVWTGIDDEGGEDMDSGAAVDTAEVTESKEAPAASTTKYVPPALRKQQAAAAAAADHGDSAKNGSSAATMEEVQDPRLRRLLLGLLNRLSPTNFPLLILSPSEPSSLHALYLSNSRGVITRLLLSLILETVLAQGDGLGETQLVVLAALVKVLSTGMVGGMNASGGRELGASMVEKLIKKLDELEDQGKEEERKERKGNSDKQRLNPVHFLGMLYNFQVVGCTIVYDLIKECVSKGLREGDVEALLRILKVSGPQLRHDDPTSLRSIISLVNTTLSSSSISSIAQSTRTKFMLEQLTNLRNNKLKPPTGVAADAESSLKKYITNLVRKASSHSGSVGNEPLRLTLSDLRGSDSVGKWWLTGAPWAGNPLVDRAAEFGRIGGGGPDDEEMEELGEEKKKEREMLRLAKKMGMNTDVRRKVFVAIMGSEDYIDAFTRLNALSLTEVQSREIVRVVLHCLRSEAVYNPYYTLIMSRLLTHTTSSSLVHSYQITLQYALWDFFRTSLGEQDVGGQEMTSSSTGAVDKGAGNDKPSRNMAKAYAWWCAKAGLGLNILKPLPFPTLLAPARSFLAHFFSALFLSTQSPSPLLLLPANKQSTFDASAVENVFLALASSHPACAQGISWFLESSKEYKKLERKDETGLLQAAREAAGEALVAGLEYAR